MSVKLSNMMHSSNSVLTLLATLRCKPEEESLQVITWHRTPTVPLVYCYKSTTTYVRQIKTDFRALFKSEASYNSSLHLLLILIRDL